MSMGPEVSMDVLLGGLWLSAVFRLKGTPGPESPSAAQAGALEASGALWLCCGSRDVQNPVSPVPRLSGS